MLSEGTISNLPPMMDQQEFADQVGISIKTVRDYVGKGYLPIVKLSNAHTVSKRSFVNVVALQDFLRANGAEWIQQQLEASS